MAFLDEGGGAIPVPYFTTPFACRTFRLELANGASAQSVTIDGGRAAPLYDAANCLTPLSNPVTVGSFFVDFRVQPLEYGRFVLSVTAAIPVVPPSVELVAQGGLKFQPVDGGYNPGCTALRVLAVVEGQPGQLLTGGPERLEVSTQPAAGVLSTDPSCASPSATVQLAIDGGVAPLFVQLPFAGQVNLTGQSPPGPVMVFSAKQANFTCDAGVCTCSGNGCN